MRKIHFWNWKLNTKYSILKFMHCRKGFHYIERDGIIFTAKSPNKKEIKRKTTFFKCRVCSIIYFPTEKDKKNWDFIEKRKDDSMKLLIDNIAKKTKKTTKLTPKTPVLT